MRLRRSWFCLPLLSAVVFAVEPQHKSASSGPQSSAGLTTETLSIEAIIDAVAQNKITNKGQFVRILPAECRIHHTKVYRSKATPCSSPENPRLLFECGEAYAAPTISFAVDGEPSPVELKKLGLADRHPDCQKIEILSSKSDRALISAEIHFGNKYEKGYAVHHSPERCFHCHGFPLQYKSPRYPAWEGFYESFLRTIRKDSEEYKNYVRHKKLHFKDKPDPLSDDPFAHMVWPKERDNGDDTIKLEMGEHADTTPNHSFSNQIARVKTWIDAVRMIEHPQFESYKYALMGAYLNCPVEEFIPLRLRKATPSFSELKATLKTRAENNRQHTIASVMKDNLGPKLGPTKFELLEAADVTADEKTPTLFVAQFMGMPISYFSSALRGDEFAEPVFGDDSLGVLFEDSETQRLRKADPKLAQKFRNSQKEFNELKDAIPNQHALCEALKKKSFAALEKTTITPIPVRDVAPSLSNNPFAKCTTCHEPQFAKLMGAPVIPFYRGPDFLKAWLAKSENKEVVGQLEHVISKNAGMLKMPPSESLSLDEEKAIRRFVKQ